MLLVVYPFCILRRFVSTSYGDAAVDRKRYVSFGRGNNNFLHFDVFLLFDGAFLLLCQLFRAPLLLKSANLSTRLARFASFPFFRQRTCKNVSFIHPRTAFRLVVLHIQQRKRTYGLRRPCSRSETQPVSQSHTAARTKKEHAADGNARCHRLPPRR